MYKVAVVGHSQTSEQISTRDPNVFFESQCDLALFLGGNDIVIYPEETEKIVCNPMELLLKCKAVAYEI